MTITFRLKPFFTTVWKISLFLTIWGLLLAPFLVLLNAERPETEQVSWTDRLLFDAIGLPLMLFAAWIMTRFVDKRPFVSLGFENKHIARDLGFGTLAGALQLVVAVIICFLFGGVFRSESVSGSLLAVMGLTLLLNAAEQELLARGYILQTIRDHSNTIIALWASSFLFMLMHAGVLFRGGVLPAINLFLAGLLFGLAYLRTQNLWLPIGIHFGWNFLQGPVLGLTVSGQDIKGPWQLVELSGPAWLTGGEFGPEGGIAATIVVISGIGIIHFMRKSQGSFTE